MKPEQKIPFGLWPSPITARMASQRIRLIDVQWNSDGENLILLEGHGDRGVLTALPLNGPRRDLTAEQNVRGGVGYGGGEFNIFEDYLIFVEKDGRLFSHSLGYGQPRPLTPVLGKAASPVLSPDLSWVVYVFSDGSSDCLALVDVEGENWPVQLVRGSDFYMQPVWHPRGTKLAWVEWDHPNMPWDGARLKLADVVMDGQPRLSRQDVIAGDDDTPVFQPLFSPDGRWLSYIVSNGEWEDLVLYDLNDGQRHVLLHGEEFMFSQPAWVQGMRTYAWNYDSQSLFCIVDTHGRASLWQIRLDGTWREIDIAPYTWISQLSASPVREAVAFLASSPDVPERVVYWDGEHARVLAYSGGETLSPDLFARPQELTWKAADGTNVYGWYYAPTHPTASGDGLPPCIVYVHGGPTSTTPLSFSMQRSYYTSRGYAWLDLNYRGSTAFGRSYMKALRRHWGDVDTEDAGGAALALAEAGLADPRRLVILGGSAGGYLVLNTLVRYPGCYKAGVCNYGVSNLFTLAMDTHKFEAHYNDSLVGPLPEAAARYHDWSPVFHAACIRDPLAIFQGDADVVVPPSQSEEIVAALRSSGVPFLYQIYAGEGHGFRKPETLNDYYRQVERFLQQYVLFAPGPVND